MKDKLPLTNVKETSDQMIKKLQPHIDMISLCYEQLKSNPSDNIRIHIEAVIRDKKLSLIEEIIKISEDGK